jgi:hypothetical protein
MTEPSTTRRGLLTAAGATLLAGCSGLDGSSDDESDPISALRLQDIVPADESEPVVADSRPVAIEQARLAASTRRVSELVDKLPVPFGPESVPNGYVRQQLTDAATDATDNVAAARAAGSRLVALDRIRRARADARFAAAGWAFVDSGVTEAELQADHREIVGEAQSARDDIEYLGTDPVAAALVYGLTETYLDSVLGDRRQSPNRESSQLLTVAEWGEDVESVRAHVDDAQYLSDQYQSSLPDDAVSVEALLSAAVDALTDDLRSRRDDLPPEPTDDDNHLLWRLRYDLRDNAAYSVDRVTDAPGPASGLLAATEGLTDQLAHDRLQTMIDDGETFGVTEAADVRDRRTQAVKAIRTALEASPRPALARPILADAARSVSFADERLADYDGDIRPERLADQLFEYISATLRARSVATACQQTLNVLDR